MSEVRLSTQMGLKMILQCLIGDFDAKSIPN